MQPMSNKALSSRRMNVGIEEVSVPRYLDRPQIVLTKSGRNELRVSEFNRWAEPLSSGISRVLADVISTYLPNSLIKPKSYATESFDYTVNIEINKFDAVMYRKAELDAWWTIYKGNRIVARGRTKLDNKPRSGYNGIVAEQSSMINTMAEQIARKLIRL